MRTSFKKADDTITFSVSWATLGLITLFLASLKLAGLISASWWAVTAPLWLMPAFILLVAALILGFTVLVTLLAAVGAVFAVVLGDRE